MTKKERTKTRCIKFVSVAGVPCWLFEHETIWVFCNKGKKNMTRLLAFNFGLIENECFLVVDGVVNDMTNVFLLLRCQL